MMKRALVALSCFTCLGSGWLILMYAVLRHGGYLWRMAMALFLIAQSAHTLAATMAPEVRPWSRPVLLAGACAIAGIAASAFLANGAAPHREGYADVIALALLAQAGLTLVVFGRRRAAVW
jgi:hypothetical protein